MANSTKLTKTAATKKLQLNDTYALDCILNAMQEDGMGDFEKIVDGDDTTEVPAAVFNLVLENLQKYAAATSEVAGLIGEVPKDVSEAEKALVNVPADDLEAAIDLQSTISSKMFYALQQIQQYAGFNLADIMSAQREQAYQEQKARNDVQFLANRMAEVENEMHELERLGIRNLDAEKSIMADIDGIYGQLDQFKARSVNFRQALRQKSIVK